jgi:hypothetical protein
VAPKSLSSGSFSAPSHGARGHVAARVKADSCDPLAALYWAQTVRPGVADPLGQLAFVIRWERGEIGGLPHCHVLISRFPERSINPSTCFAMKNTWTHGISQVRLYDPYGPGDVSKYLSKGRFSSAADCEGANTYELRKFNRADCLYISAGAWAEMREARTVARRMSPLSS